MQLKEYQKKRDFNKTPEPTGETNIGDAKRFVVQKHAASRLHYDFRLEYNGVLKSWAVPKGPSLNPADKRLAKMVEDHPLDYQFFEGIIPTGSYGAGAVIVWDNGSYWCQKNFDDGLNKGHISVILDGTKLKGEFNLIRTNKDENTWLLIKKDDYFTNEADITEMDRSVISNKTIEEISENVEFNSTPKEEMPNFVKPMLAETAPGPFDGSDWLFEIKWDGYRAIGEKNKERVLLYSRKGIKFGQFGAVESELEKIDHEFILDGEVVATDENGISKFQLLQDYQLTRKGNLIYFVFDILHLDGYNLRGLNILERKNILKKILPVDSKIIRYSDHILETGKEFFKQARGKNLEGIMAKRISSIYLPGRRTSSWLKIKLKNRQEALICGYTAPREGRKNFGALVLGVNENDDLRYIGHTGSGFSEITLEYVYKKLQPLITDKCPFKIVPQTNEKATWVKPELVCEVEFQEWTNDGIMRVPIFLGLREDKDPKPPTTNLDKIYWPNEGYTKGDLINYYKKISKFILPHLIGRPENLYRQPHGIDQPGFWHKNMEILPDWINTAKIFSESQNKTNKYLVCNNEETLLYMINLGCIEIHPWFSRVGFLNYPDYLVFDLDPEDISFERVIDVANILKEILDRADVPSFCKTSGSRGLHIMVPLGAKYSYETAVTFARIIAILALRRNKEIISLERDPEARRHKVYIDYVQNGRGKTITAPYSARAKPGAPVSTPLKWSEVKHGLNPGAFNIQTVLSRLESVGDIFFPILNSKIDMDRVMSKLSDLI